MSEKLIDHKPNEDEAESAFDLEAPSKDSKYRKAWIWTMCCTPVVYIIVIVAVLIKPEIMAMVGLLPFIEYLMYEVQTEGYHNLLRLRDHEFAVYFFHFHAANILLHGLAIVPNLTILHLFVKNHPDPFIIKARFEGEGHKPPSRKHLILLLIGMILFSVMIFWCVSSWPSTVGNDPKFSIVTGLFNGMSIKFPFFGSLSALGTVVMLNNWYFCTLFYIAPKIKSWYGKCT